MQYERTLSKKRSAEEANLIDINLSSELRKAKCLTSQQINNEIETLIPNVKTKDIYLTNRIGR